MRDAHQSNPCIHGIHPCDRGFMSSMMGNKHISESETGNLQTISNVISLNGIGREVAKGIFSASRACHVAMRLLFQKIQSSDTINLCGSYIYIQFVRVHDIEAEST